MNDYKRTVLNWGIVMILFLIIASASIGLVFQPAVLHIMYKEPFEDKQEYRNAPSALTIDGMVLRAQAWIEYPEYNIGLGCLALLSLVRAVFTSRTMYSLRENNFDALQSNSSEVKEE